jgi:hypothetical protein
MRVPRFRLRPSKKEEEALVSAFRDGHHARGPNLCKFMVSLMSAQYQFIENVCESFTMFNPIFELVF